MRKYILIVLLFFCQSVLANCLEINVNQKKKDAELYLEFNESRLNGDNKKIRDLIKQMDVGYYRSYILGYFYLIGKGELRDLKKAEEYFLESAKYCYAPSYYNLGYLYSIKGEFDLAKYYYGVGAKLGSVYSIYELARIYKKEGDYGLYIDFILRAGERDFTEALMDLGDLYYNGVFVERDFNKSYEYYRRASLYNEEALNKMKYMF